MFLKNVGKCFSIYFSIHLILQVHTILYLTLVLQGILIPLSLDLKNILIMLFRFRLGYEWVFFLVQTQVFIISIGGGLLDNLLCKH